MPALSKEKKDLAELSIKRCCKCLRILHFSEFMKSPTGSFGVYWRCRGCVNEKRRTATANRSGPPPRRKRNKATDLAWTKANPEKIKANRIRSARAKAMRVDWQLHNRMRCGIRDCLKGRRKGKRTFELLGFSVAELQSHLERQFTQGMSWDNMGDWHIDHILPKASFNILEEGDEEFRRCWALANLRPLWAGENAMKKDKVLFLC